MERVVGGLIFVFRLAPQTGRGKQREDSKNSHSLSLLGSNGLQGVDTRGSSRRSESGEGGYDNERQDSSRERGNIHGTDTEQDGAEYTVGQDRQYEPRSQADRQQAHHTAGHMTGDLRGAGSQGDADADFARACGNGQRNKAIETNRRQQKRGERKSGEHSRVEPRSLQGRVDYVLDRLQAEYGARGIDLVDDGN